ncbi:MAG TPA: hypothetical protein VJ508_13180, partial [Saprospiraceae bacterium]|nr:hypothetical protein [Saprospiraceae bacterium]
TLYTAMNLPGQLAKIIAVNIDNGRIQSLCDVHTPALYYVTSLAFDRSGQRLFFTTHNSRFWRGLNMVDLKTGESRELMNDDRIGDLVYNHNDSCIWGVQHNNGYSSVVRIIPPYNGWQVIFTLKYGKDLFDIDISPDGKYLSGSLVEISGRQTLVEIPIDSLLKGVVTYETLLEFENDTSPYNFSYSQDGKYLYGSTYYTGVSNIVRFNRSLRQKEWISNCETGFFRPVSMGNDSVLVYRYTGKGFLPVIIADKPLDDVSPVRYLGREIVDKRPIVTTWAVKSPLTINLDTLNVSSGEYNGLNHLRFISAYPIVEGYKDHISFGMRTDFTDPAFDHTVDASISYSPNRNLPEDERFHGTFNYQYSHWKLNARYNGADFYDL